ncbi:MAG TPA: RNA polymerase sigma factor [Actinocatenispora sp.]
MGEWSWVSDRLIEGARGGNAEAISAMLYGAHPHVRRFARSLCATPQDAEDAAQEALIILFRKIGTVRASGALASWLFRIVRNECARRYRLLARRYPEPVEPPLGRSAEDEVLGRLDADRVAAAIAELPDLQRRVLIMRDVQGYPGRAVADDLGISLAAMKSQLHRARLALRQNLADTKELP